MKYQLLFLLASLPTLITAGTTSTHGPLFQARIDYPVNGYPTIADFDGDGDKDLAVVDASIVTILLNNGHGIFATAATYELGAFARFVVSADLDGDTDYDLAVPSSNVILVLFNNGDGTFAEPVSHPAELNPQALFSADLDGDGDIDLAVANHGWWGHPGYVSILLNSGDGTFAAAVKYMEGEYPASIFSIDLDGDNDLDLAVGCAYGNISILLNNGNGTFAPPSDLGSGAYTVFLADFDGDGNNDLAAASGSDIAIMLNNGDATFSEPISYPTRLFAFFIVATDLDGDGDYDLAAVNSDFAEFDENRLSVLLNNGDGTFGLPIIYMRGRAVSRVISADLDGDNDNDLVMRSDDRISVLLNKGDGTFPNRTWLYTSVGERGAACSADLDGDGDIDIAKACWGYGSEPGEWPPVLIPYCAFSLYLNNGDGSFDRPSSSILHPEAHANSIVGADFDGDGDYDLAMGFTDAPSGVHILSNNGDGTFKDPVEYAMATNVTSVCDADLDGDGDIDLATAGAGILLNNGDGTFMEPMESWPGNDIFAADLDGDDDQDLVIGRSSSILILKNNGDATFETTILDGLAGDDVSLTDLDNDNDYDLVIMNANTVDVSILLNNGNASFAAPINYNAGIFPDDIFTADLNGDGNIDLALAGKDTKVSTLFCSFVSVLINNGDGTFETPLNYGLEYWDIDEITYAGPDPIEIWITGADLDGDRDIDLAADRYILFNQSGYMPGTISAGIDIKPGSCPNPINLNGNIHHSKAVLPVAILGTDDFDVHDIDPSTIMLESAPVVRWSYEDVASPYAYENDSCSCDSAGPDGIEDLTLKFYRADMVAVLDGAGHGDIVPLTLTGMLYDSTVIEGTDCVWIRNDGKPDNASAAPLFDEVVLYPNSPNPFNPVTRIAFDLPEATHAKLDIFNVLGQRVATIVDQQLGAGTHDFIWNAGNVASGLYFYRLTAGEQTQIRKMLLLK